MLPSARFQAAFRVGQLRILGNERSICIFKYHYCDLYIARRAQSYILALLPALAVAITHLLMIIRKVSETDGNNGELAY